MLLCFLQIYPEERITPWGFFFAMFRRAAFLLLPSSLFAGFSYVFTCLWLIFIASVCVSENFLYL